MGLERRRRLYRPDRKGIGRVAAHPRVHDNCPGTVRGLPALHRSAVCNSRTSRAGVSWAWRCSIPGQLPCCTVGLPQGGSVGDSESRRAGYGLGPRRRPRCESPRQPSPWHMESHRLATGHRTPTSGGDPLGVGRLGSIHLVRRRLPFGQAGQLHRLRPLCDQRNPGPHFGIPCWDMGDAFGPRYSSR